MNEKMNDALNQVRDAYIEEAAKAKKRRPYWFAAVAAVLALVIALSAVVRGGPADPTDPQLQESTPGASDPTDPQSGGIISPDALGLANLVASPVYPKMLKEPDIGEYLSDLGAYSEAVTAWQQCRREQYDQPEGYADSLAEFFADSMAQFLQGGENKAYSPVNVYMALAMLAETTGGNSRQQILDLLGLNTIEELRQQASFVWNAHYSDDGETTLLMANSLWLDEAYSFKQTAVDTLASDYYAATFSGDLGTEALDEQLRQWLNACTGGLLEDQADNVSLDPNTVFALASTMYFSARWKNEFETDQTETDTFHGYEADSQADFMHQSFEEYKLYWGENFTAIYLALYGENKMWLILPDEGYTVDDILQSDDYLQMTLDPGSWENKGTYQVNLSLPKFDVSYQQDLVDGMKELGVTDIFDYSISDFTPVTDTPELYVSQINHAARVAIDEEGCVAAAFTVSTMSGDAMPPELEIIDFVLDRPFLFVVSSRDDLPLFAGTVLEP